MILAEKEKYEKAWAHKAYRNYSPGEKMVIPYLCIAKPKAGSTITDFGTGTGRAALMLHEMGYNVQLIDIAENCLDDEVKEQIGGKLGIMSLYGGPCWIRHSEHGYCTDVMEHIPPEFVDETLKNIFRSADKVFFQICLQEDHFGQELGETLHLTVKPFTWWRDKLGEYAEIIEARDLIHNGLFYAIT